MTLSWRRTLVLLCSLFGGAAGAQGLPPGLVSQLVALGLPEPQGPTASGIYTATPKGAGLGAGLGTAYIHNKTRDGSWVAVLPKVDPGRLAAVTGRLGATASNPVLVVALKEGSSPSDMLPPELSRELPTATLAGAAGLAWKPGINLLTRLEAGAAGALKSLQDSGVYPAGGALLSGTLGAAVLSGQVNGDWSVTLDAALGAWAPADSPLSAQGAVFKVRQERTGVAATARSIGFGIDLTGARLNWPGYTSPAIPLSLALTLRSPTDVELSGSLADFRVGPRAFTVTSTEFFYATAGTMTGVGLRVRFNTAMGKSSPQRWTAQVKGGTTGAIGFKGTLDSDWVNPLGLQDFSFLKGTAIDFSFAADGDLGLGITGQLRKGTDTWRTSACANIQVAPSPVLKAVGLALDPPRLSPAALLELSSGLMAEVGRGSPDPKLAAAMKATAADLSELPLPEMQGASLLVYTPGLDCAQDRFKGLTGFGGSFKGKASFLGKPVAAIDNVLAVNGNADDRLSMNNSLGDFNLGGVIGLQGARLAVNAPLALGPNVAKAAMTVTGRADIAGSRGMELVVRFSADKARFGFDADLPLLGRLAFNAESQGSSLVQMEDFRLSASVSADSAARKALVKELQDLLLATARRQQADPKLKAGHQAVANAQARLEAASRRLKAKAARWLGNCQTADLGGCIGQALAQSLENLDEFKDWMLAVAERDRLLLKHHAEKFAFETWQGIEKALAGAASTTAPFSVKNVAVDGGLRSGDVTTSVEWSFLGRAATSTFTARFGAAGRFGSDSQRDGFARTAAFGGPNVPPPAAPQLAGAPTTTTVTPADVTEGAAGPRKVLTVVVGSAEGVSCKGAIERPSGTVYLYMRRPGDAPPDPFTDHPTKPVQIGTATLGQGSNCTPGDTVKFNAAAGNSNSAQACPNRFFGITDFQELRGPVIFTALFQGGPTACSAPNEDLNHPANGFRASLSDDLEVTFPGRTDDRGLIRSAEAPDGQWQRVADCPAGTWAAGFRQRVEPLDLAKDDKGLNAVQLVCRKPDGTGETRISSHDGRAGAWSQPQSCGTGRFISEARIRLEEQPQLKPRPASPGLIFRDRIGAADTRFRCNDNTETTRKTELLADNGIDRGRWSAWGSCPEKTAVCGIAVKMGDDAQRGQDDTALNGMQLRCCALP